MGGSSLAPGGAAAHLRGRPASTSSTRRIRGDPRARGVDRPRADALRLGVEVGLDARDALAHRLLLGADREARTAFAPSPIPAPSSSVSRGSVASGASSRRADDRRPLLGALAVRDRPRGADGRRRRRACSSGRRRWPRPAAPATAIPATSSAASSAPAGRTGATRSASARDRRLRPLGRAADRRIDRQARARGSSPRPASRRTGPTGRPPSRSSPIRTSSAASSSAGSSRSPSPASILEINPFDQPDVQAAKDKTNEVLAAGERARRRARGLDRRAARAGAGGRLRLRPGLHRAGRRPRSQLVDSLRRRSGLRGHARLRAAVPALDGPAAQGRPEHRPASCRSSTTRATSSRSPASDVRLPAADPRAGGGRLRVAEGARPPRRRVRLEDL